MSATFALIVVPIIYGLSMTILVFIDTAVIERRFSMRSLLIVMTLTAVLLGVIAAVGK